MIDNICYPVYNETKKGRINMSVNKRCPSCGYTVEDGMILARCVESHWILRLLKKANPILSVVLLLVLWPIGIAIMWATETFQKRTRVVITVIYLLLFFVAIAMVATNKPTVTKGSGTAGIHN